MAERNTEKPKRRIWEKVLMGAVIGGAIGSVVGAAEKFKPKENVEQKQKTPKEKQ